MNTEPTLTEEGIWILPIGWGAEELTRWKEANGVPHVRGQNWRRRVAKTAHLRRTAKNGGKSTQRGRA